MPTTEIYVTKGGRTEAHLCNRRRCVRHRRLWDRARRPDRRRRLAESGCDADPSSTAVPTVVPSPSASFVDLPVGSLDPGTTYRISDRCCVGPAGMYLTVPAGWETGDTIFVGKNILGDPDLYDILLGAHLVGNVFSGGCHWQGTALDPPVGPTVDDLATALAAQREPGTAAPTDVTIGGNPGKKVEMSIPDDVDTGTCDRQDGFPVFGRWSPVDNIGQPWTYGDGQHNTVYIVDVDGTRQVIDTMYLPGTTPANSR